MTGRVFGIARDRFIFSTSAVCTLLLFGNKLSFQHYGQMVITNCSSEIITGKTDIPNFGPKEFDQRFECLKQFETLKA